VLDASVALLNRFSAHLDAHPSGTVQRKAFFLSDGTVSGVGRSAPRVVLALAHISTELKKPTSPIKDAGNWQKDFENQLAVLSPVTDLGHAAQADKKITTIEVEAARAAWLHVYKGAKKVCDGVLSMAGKRALLKTVFWDMSVPADTKLTHDPAGTSEVYPGKQPAQPNP